MERIYCFLAEAFTTSLPTTLMVVAVVVLFVALALSLLRRGSVNLREGRMRFSSMGRRRQGEDLVHQGNTQIAQAQADQARAPAMIANPDPAVQAQGRALQISAATMLNAGQADVDRGTQLLAENPLYERQWGTAVVVGLLMIAAVLLGSLIQGLLNRGVEAAGGKGSSDAARACQNMVAKAEMVTAPGYSVVVDGSRFELHMPFKGLPAEQQTEWKKVVDDTVKAWNNANPAEHRRVKTYDGATLVGYKRDGKFQGVLLSFTGEQHVGGNVWKEMNFNYIHALRSVGPSAVVRTADQLAQKLDTLAAGGGAPAGLPGVGALQGAAPQF